MSQLIQLSRHSYVYRGFTIYKCPINRTTAKRAYSVLNNGNYFGRDFALAEACRTIDLIISRNRFIRN
ncbi:DUF4761 family protein [Klebsiella aerogenes]|uniref:DUF4761 family protein n=1 Tax=Klebsiella TaxID=570 RepID=UPI0019142BF1|nr:MULTISPECIES: DUF4761 family protein [Klebsiella]DAY50657.1 MAG TPA: protein of unknown function (DUF4761) [Caudoviricetes sp.]HDG8066634.1 DUF4761 family protein [Klebsiella pneumoniae]MCW9589652.1 DUF4761 family protein [Klebsiella oxytoca]MCW9600919.1 DUF4761 family protein [Klebsiella oxytoca]MCW9623813.1 DUF4761 family protein [Klebsiella oxytoca]